MTTREEYERRLRDLLKREGVDPMPPDEEIAEVVDFFARHGARALPMMRRAGRELIRAHQEREGDPGENHARPPTTPSA
jgi:hypothetical protein